MYIISGRDRKTVGAGAVVHLTAAMATQITTVASKSKVPAFSTANVRAIDNALPIATNLMDIAMMTLAVQMATDLNSGGSYLPYFSKSF